METGDISQRKTSRDLKYIAKYLLGNGFSEEYTISYLIDFMNNYNNSGSRWKNTIVGIVKDIRKQNNYFLRDINEIRITQNEINTIKNINWDFPYIFLSNSDVFTLQLLMSESNIFSCTSISLIFFIIFSFSLRFASLIVRCSSVSYI